MELSAIGEQVFAVESIIKKRVRKVREPRRLGLVVLQKYPLLSCFLVLRSGDFKQLRVYIINMTPCLNKEGGEPSDLFTSAL